MVYINYVAKSTQVFILGRLRDRLILAQMNIWWLGMINPLSFLPGHHFSPEGNVFLFQVGINPFHKQLKIIRRTVNDDVIVLNKIRSR